MTTTTDVVVIGGGLAGLTAAATARAAGASVLVLEGQVPGGRARVTEKEGFTFNLGAHALYLGGEAAAVLGRLGVEPRGSRPPLRDYRLLVDGELHAMPTGPVSLLRTSALSLAAKAALGRLLARLARIDVAAIAGSSVDEWIGDAGLPGDAAAVLRALLRIGTYADDFSTFDAGAAVQQLQRSAARGVLYLDGGWAQLIDGLSSQVDLRTGVKVHRVADGAVETGAGTFRARSIVVAAGPPAACAAVLPVDPGWGDLGEPVYAAALDVGVRGTPTPGYVLGVDVPVYGTTQSPPARHAPAGDSVVAVVRYGARDVTEDRADLEGWLAHLGVRPEAIVCSRFLARMAVVGAAPLARNGGLGGRPSIAATGLDGVFVAGDWVGPEGHLADASFASGEAAGRAAAAAATRRPSGRATMVR